VPNETDVVAGDRADLAPLANALVEARLLTHGGGTLEIAHETLLRRQPISVWLEEQKDALKRGALYLRPPLGLTRANAPPAEVALHAILSLAKGPFARRFLHYTYPIVIGGTVHAWPWSSIRFRIDVADWRHSIGARSKGKARRRHSGRDQGRG
jgi:hypothetical protein